MEDLVGWCKKKGLSCAVTDIAALQKAAGFIHEKLGKI